MRERNKIPRWIWIGVLGLLAAGLTACTAAEAEPQPAGPAEPAAAEAVPVPEAQPEPEPEPEPVPYLRHTAYIQGEDGYFFPEKLLTRAEAAQLLVNLFGGAAAEAPVFSDVPADTWYAPSVASASALLPGYEDGCFYPKNSVTLLELLEALCRGMELADVSLENPPPEEASPAAAAALERGWIGEAEDLEQPLTRAQAVVLLNRVLERTPDRETAAGLDALVFLDVGPEHEAYADILEATLSHDYIPEADGEAWSEESVSDAGLSAGLHMAGGYAQYVLEDGTVWTEPGLFQAGDETYLLSEDGQVYTDMALHLTDGKVVFATADGTLLKNASWDQYQFDEDGFYTTGSETLDAYVEQALAACTTEDMTREEKLRACFDYVRAFRYLGRNAALPSSVQVMPMENAVAYANKIFETGKGDCYNFAASFCFLARALGYEATAVVGSCGYVWSSVAIAHGWVEITMDGQVYLFDPEIENYNLRAGISNEIRGAFQVTYGTAPGNYYKN